ncbi:MAG TPA: hypothetical protein VK204_07250 [Nocardioidaceae bacterium]|nr:hypothetical protein [Nocardioidaceae bacterium]
MRAAVIVLVAGALLGGCGQEREDGVGKTGDFSCAALLVYDGHRYTAHGELRRDPATTGRVGSGVAPGCDDGGGATRDRRVEVAELADLPKDRAVLVEGELYVRADQPFPEAARAWFVAPRCGTSREFELRGDWLSVQGPNRPRFDGDLRPPYRLGVHVTDGPDEYVGATIQIRATETTHPVLGPKDVKTSLWKGGGVIAQVRCEAGHFIASSLTSKGG